MAMPSRMVPSTAPARPCNVGPNHSTEDAHNNPTRPSISGYWREIGWWQWRHFPLRSSHDTTGMLSRHAMRRLHCGHVDGGLTSDWSCGRRRIHTLRKLPKQSPTTPAPTTSSQSAPTLHLVEEDARRDRDIERLGAGRERNCHTLRGDRVQRRPDARALVSHDPRDGSGMLEPR